MDGAASRLARNMLREARSPDSPHSANSANGCTSRDWSSMPQFTQLTRPKMRPYVHRCYRGDRRFYSGTGKLGDDARRLRARWRRDASWPASGCQLRL